MAQTQIHGSTQIQANTVTSGQVDTSIVVVGGTHAFTGDQSLGGHKATNLANGTSSSDAVNLGQVQALLNGFSFKTVVQACATGSETFTIASGSVTQIAGTTVDGVTLAIGDQVLIPTAPASTGTGTALSSGVGTAQPGNGIYTVTGNTTNLSVSRAADLSGSINPAGAFVLVEAGSAGKGTAFWVASPASPDTAFTYGTTNLQWDAFPLGSGVTSVSIATQNGFTGSVANSTTTPSVTVALNSLTGMLKGTGAGVTTATSGTDFLASGNLATRETPTGSINGSNTSFSLANTPISGTEMVFLNGILQDAGAGNDYTISSGTITMLSAPLSGDKIRATYFH